MCEGVIVSFSVIIPTFGRPAYLADAIASLRAQTVLDFEVVVVDDASPEPVRVDEDERTRVVRLATNGGAGRARNAGVEVARGDNLAFLDDDDAWHPRRLEMAVAGLARAPVAVCWQSPHGRMIEGNAYDRILDSTTPSLGATALRRSAWRPFDADYRSCEDLVWWLDIARENPIATVPEQGLFVRRHDGPRDGYGTEQRIRDSYRLLEDRADYFHSHPRAAAFRLRRIGLMSAAIGDGRSARRAHARALRIDPSLRGLAHLARATQPSRLRA